MTNPMLAELDAVVRLMEAASFVDLDWGWRRDDDDTPGSIFTHSFGGMHQAVAMCPRYGKDSFAADASYIVALHNFLRTHHATLADMAKRLEAAERDSKRLDALEQMANQPGGILIHDGSESGRCGIGLRPGFASRTLREAIDATQEGEG